jgi:hypothetical protein
MWVSTLETHCVGKEDKVISIKASLRPSYPKEGFPLDPKHCGAFSQSSGIGETCLKREVETQNS